MLPWLACKLLIALRAIDVLVAAPVDCGACIVHVLFCVRASLHRAVVYVLVFSVIIAGV